MIQTDSSYELYSKRRKIQSIHQFPKKHVLQERASGISQNSNPQIQQSDKYYPENRNTEVHGVSKFDLSIYQKISEPSPFKQDINMLKSENASDFRESTNLLLKEGPMWVAKQQNQLNSTSQSKNSHEYQLVLLTTESGFTERIQNKSRLFRSLVDIYSKNYNFHCIMFTNTSELIDYYSNSSVTTITQFETNRFGLPIVTNLFAIAQKHFLSKYYGYVNADILVENNVFEVLSILEGASQDGIITPMHELAGRVYEKSYTDLPLLFRDIHDVNSFFQTIPLSKYTLRNAGSAVCLFSP